ncbi:MAG: SCP2 sterol-binding domain-containing protein [Gammaproteobacteria bacterium]|nr:SCP2 sterol-binding domain-containing protein [Gammaproteobacteria bacterium]
MNSIFHSTIYSVIETGLNQALSLDPGTRKQMESLSGKCIRIHCQSPRLLLNILVCEQHLSLSANEALQADVSIKGNASALMKLLVTKNTAKLRQDGIVISGDVGLLGKFQAILQNLDIDWEYQLSKLIGDIPTQFAHDSIHSAGRFAKKTRHNLEEDIDNYLHEEARLFPSETELKEFYQSVDALRLRVDRLKARTGKLQSTFADVIPD